jgi:hypothetical protein
MRFGERKIIRWFWVFCSVRFKAWVMSFKWQRSSNQALLLLYSALTPLQTPLGFRIFGITSLSTNAIFKFLHNRIPLF